MTIVLLLPDVWLLVRHEPPAAVAILMCMHLGIALVTYNALVHVAPARVVPPGDCDKEWWGRERGRGPSDVKSRRRGMVEAAAFRVGRWVWILMMIGLGRVGTWDRGVGRRTGSSIQRLGPREGCSGLSDPRRTRGNPDPCRDVARDRVAPRADRACGITIGLAGLALGAGGGILAVYHASRFAGLALMFVGTLVAFFGYLLPLAEPDPRSRSESSGRNARDHPKDSPACVKITRWQMNGRSSSTTAGASTSG